MFICKLFQSSLQVGQLKCTWRSTGLVHIKTIVVFFTGVQYLAETLLNKIRLTKYSKKQNTVIRASIFPKVLKNAHCTPVNPKI